MADRPVRKPLFVEDKHPFASVRNFAIEVDGTTAMNGLGHTCHGLRCRAPAPPPRGANGANDGSGLSPPTNDQQIFALHVQPGGHGIVAMIGVDIALEPLKAVRRQALGELAQRAEAACVNPKYPARCRGRRC